MNEQSAGYAELPRTSYLDHTLRRARSAAEQRSHRYVTLEHLLLALLDDPDATKLLRNCGADISLIRVTVSDAVNNRMASLVVPDGRSPNFSYKFDSLFAGASREAMRMGRTEIDGALALIAVAKEPETNASAILAANGFAAETALQSIAAAPELRQARAPAKDAPQKPKPPQPGPRPQPPAGVAQAPQAPVNGAASSRPKAALPPAPKPLSADESMDDMIASVRNILEAEERKDRAAPSQPRTPAPRAEQRANGGPVRKAELAEPAAEPLFAPAQAPQPGFAEAPSSAFDLEKSSKAESRAVARAPGRRKVGNVAVVAKVLTTIPRKARVAVPETIEILLSKQEAGLIFGWLSRQGPQQGAESACRAISIRLSAPDGGFFIEGQTPETQWLLDRPSFLGEEAFGTWAWTAIPNDSGAFGLKVSMWAREVDASGVTNDIALPDQVIKVQVGGNFWRGFGRYLRSVLLLLAGSGLTVAAYYALKAAGKLPLLP
jgi:hypothetical protein